MIAGRADSRATMLAQQLLVFLAAALLLALGMDRELGVYDEGVILTGAMRVAAGDIPHADFYANYGPGEFYLIAALFKLFGQYAVVERVYDVLVRAMIVAVCYGLAAGYARKDVALAAAAICGLWLFSLPFYGYPIFPVALLSLFAAILILPVLAGQFSSWRLAVAGALVALAGLIRYDVGFVVFAAFAAVLPLSSVLRTRDTRHALGDAKAVLLPYVIGTCAIFLPVAACYLAVAPIAPFIHDIFSFSIRYYARMRSLPFPGLLATLGSIDNAGVYLPILICAAAACSLFLGRAGIRGRSRTPSGDNAIERRKDWLLIMLTVVTTALYLKGLVRVSIAHMVASIIPSLVLLAVLLERAWHQGQVARIAAGALCALSVASAGYAAITAAQFRLALDSTVLAAMAAPRAADNSWCPTPSELRRIQCLLLDPDREGATRFVVANTRPDERIFVGLGRHDKIFINDDLMYFATGRMPATRWHQFDAGLQTRADIQGKIIAELQARRVRYVVLESTWDGVAEPNGSAISSGVHLLDEYIRSNYRPVQVYGQVTVFFREY
jgi:Dolichyl-phosphate-mannose-protein mannosyltransferase